MDAMKKGITAKNSTNSSQYYTTVEDAEKGVKTKESTENATTPVTPQVTHNGNSTKAHKNESLSTTPESVQWTTATQANTTMGNTTQAFSAGNNTNSTQNASELFTFEKGVNISARVFFYYDLDYQMEAYLRDQGDCKDIENYLRALLNSAALRFKPLENGTVKLLFGGSKLLSNHETQDIRVFQQDSLTVSTLYLFQRFIQYHPPSRPDADIYVYISK
ncbi:uncharacterized protein LOC144102671 [Amblyomma americanum]